MSQEQTNPSPAARKEVPRVVMYLATLFLLLLAGGVVVPLGLTGLAYSRGHGDYLQADCAAAIPEFNRVLSASWLPDIAGFAARAFQERMECAAFQQAVELEKSNALDAALKGYVDFIASYDSSPLTSVAQRKVDSLFGNNDPHALASPDTCNQVNFLRGRTWEAHKPASEIWPPFYWGCVQAFEAADQPAESYRWYRTLLTEYPQHPLARQAADKLLADPGTAACDGIELLRAEPVIEASFPELAPGLYIKCGKKYEAEGKPAEAYTQYRNFLRSYPGHPLTVAVVAALLKNPTACEHTTEFETNGSNQAASFLPELYLSCGQMLAGSGKPQAAYEMYTSLLTDYPAHASAPAAETALLESPAACEQSEKLASSPIASRPDFMPRLFFNCAQSLRAAEKFEQAVELYNRILTESPKSPTASEAAVAIGWAHCDWGKSLSAQNKFDQAMQHYQTARSATKDEAVTQAADDGHNAALWALARDQAGEGKQVLDESYDLVCDGRSAVSPAVGLAKEESKQGLLCSYQSEYQIKLPSDMVALDPAHFQYAIQIETGGTAYDTCTYGQPYYDPKTGISYRNYHYLIRRKMWVKVIIRSTRTGGVITQREFAEFPEKCPANHIFTETTEYLIAPWPEQEEIIAWLRNWLK